MRDDRWQHLVQLSFLLQETCAVRSLDAEGDRKVERRVQAALDDVLEVFPSSLDPTDEFEAFAVRRFAATLRGVLSAGARDA